MGVVGKRCQIHTCYVNNSTDEIAHYRDGFSNVCHHYVIYWIGKNIKLCDKLQCAANKHFLIQLVCSASYLYFVDVIISTHTVFLFKYNDTNSILIIIAYFIFDCNCISKLCTIILYKKCYDCDTQGNILPAIFWYQKYTGVSTISSGMLFFSVVYFFTFKECPKLELSVVRSSSSLLRDSFQ